MNLILAAWHLACICLYFSGTYPYYSPIGFRYRRAAAQLANY